METLAILLLIAVVFALIVTPIVVFVKLSRINRLTEKINSDNRRMFTDLSFLHKDLKRLTAMVRGEPDEEKKVRASKPPAKEVEEPAAPEEKVVPGQESPPPLPPPLPTQMPHPSAPAPAFQAVEPEPAVPSLSARAAEAARALLGRIWSWLPVGEGYRPEDVKMEFIIGTLGLLFVGIVAIVLGGGFFLKWSIEQGLLSDAARVGITIIAGVGMVGFGLNLLRGKYRPFGLGLMGGGFAMLYWSMFAAASVYGLIPAAAGFALMALVTVAVGVLSVRADSMLLSVLGIIGGYGSPLVLQTMDPNLPVLYTYMLFLTFGILGIARYKQWRLLNVLSFLFTYAVFLFTIAVAYRVSDFPVAITFLSLYFIAHSSLVYLHNILKKVPTTVVEIAHLFLNAIVYSATAYYLIEQAYGRPYPCIMSVALAIFFIVHVLAFLKNGLVDRPLLISLVGLAAFYTTWTMPLVMGKETLTLSWALQAIVFLWLSRKLNSRFLAQLAYALYGMVFFRLMVFDLGRNYSARPAVSVAGMSVYWAGMRARLVNFGVSIGSVIGAFFFQRRQQAAAPDRAPITRENDISRGVSTGLAGQILYWFGVLVLFVVLHLELNTMFVHIDPLRMPVLTMLWCAMVVYFLWTALRAGGSGSITVMSVFLVLTLLKLFLFDLRSWQFSGNGIYDMEYHALHAGMRLLDFGLVLAVLFGVWALFSRATERRKLAPVFGYTGLALLFVYATLELNTFLYWRLPDFQAGGISILWALFAISFIAGGIWRNIRPLRYAGLILFAVVIGKVFLTDLQHLKVIYRVVAFLFVGVFMLLGSFGYMFASGKFTRDTTSGDEKSDDEGEANRPSTGSGQANEHE